MRQWRLIYDPPTAGAHNMALDEAILAAVGTGDAPPTLRFYDWQPACLSLGYGQRAREADVDRLRERGWDIVRRPTGGRAILHTRELTYSLALPLDHPIAAGGIVESYQRISRALIAGLNTLTGSAVELRADPAQPDAPITPVCFETPSHYEITVGGKKLIGSAQVRRKNTMLQHGSLPLWGDIADICAVLAYPDEPAREQSKRDVRAHACTLFDAVGVEIPFAHVAEALCAGITGTFEITLSEVSLSPAELAHAERLTAEVYASDEWTFRR